MKNINPQHNQHPTAEPCNRTATSRTTLGNSKEKTWKEPRVRPIIGRNPKALEKANKKMNSKQLAEKQKKFLEMLAQLPDPEETEDE